MDTAGVPMPTMNREATNLPEAWRKFQQHAELMFSGPLKKKDEAKILKSYYDRFTAYVEPKANVIFAHYKFHEKVQGECEPFQQFVTDLRLLVKDCNYANSDEMIQERIVFGIYSPKVREKLLNMGSELTLEKAIDVARSHELAQAQLKTIASSMSTSREYAVHAISGHTSKGSVPKQRNAKYRKKYGDGFQPRSAPSVQPKECGYCGNKRHVDRSHCPAKGKVCKICGKLNHFAKVCRSNCEKTVHAISQEGSDQFEECDELFIDLVTQGRQSSDTEQVFVNIKIGPKQQEIKFKLDTGSSPNVIPLYEYTKLDS
ncbi:Retrovirus-related Pol polyprotein from transposon 412 [Labeo rohita]|uniref:Retrovirus-related Pol polyprotein from transposon 412 n=1 Tax=Labeo rohita TaxID=84645 RepID=A0A498NW39_LABRO|nr:Retrovirus-related Pol polyprotein from transposon 412 [Labeo rohita]